MKATVAAARVDPAPGDSSGGQNFRFGAAEPVFAGHFPGEPILPGVYQIEMARQAAEHDLDRTLAIVKIVKAKFSRVVRPGELIGVVVKCEETEGRIRAVATFSVGDEAAGKCVLELTADEGERP